MAEANMIFEFPSLIDILCGMEMLFQIARDELGTKWEKIPTDTDILVMSLIP